MRRVRVRLVLALVLAVPAFTGCLQGSPSDGGIMASEDMLVNVTLRPPPGLDGPVWALPLPVREFAVADGVVTLRAWADGTEGPDHRLALKWRADADAPVTRRYAPWDDALNPGEFSFLYEESIFWGGRPVNAVTRVDSASYLSVSQNGPAATDAVGFFKIDFEAECDPEAPRAECARDDAREPVRVLLDGAFPARPFRAQRVGEPEHTLRDGCMEHARPAWTLTVCPVSVTAAVGATVPFTARVTPRGSADADPVRVRPTEWVNGPRGPFDDGGWLVVPDGGASFEFQAIQGAPRTGGLLVEHANMSHELDGVRLKFGEQRHHPLRAEWGATAPAERVSWSRDADGSVTVTYRVGEGDEECPRVADGSARAYASPAGEPPTLILFVQWTRVLECAPDAPSSVRATLPPDAPRPERVVVHEAVTPCAGCPRDEWRGGWTTTGFTLPP